MASRIVSRVALAVAACLILSGDVASPEGSYSSVETFATASVKGQEIPIQTSIFAASEPEFTDAFYRLTGYSAAPGRSVPLTVRVPKGLEVNVAADAMENLRTPDGEVRFERTVFRPTPDVTKTLLSGSAPNGPFSMTVTDDPLPALPIIVAGGLVLAVCGATLVYNMMQDCPNGLECSMSVGLTGLSCTVKCSPS